MGRGELQPVRSVFRAVARTIVPPTADLDPQGWAELEARVEEALAMRSAAQRRQLRMLLRVLDLLALLTSLRHFARASPRHRARLLGWLEDAPLVLLRRGFWGLKALSLLGFYCGPEAVQRIGYRAAPAGWEERR